jgi:type II secretion system protein N
MPLDIARLRPTFPPGLAFDRVRVMRERSEVAEEVFGFQSLRLWPYWMSLLAGSRKAYFTGTSYDGRISGDVRYVGTKNSPGWEVQAQFADLDVSRYPLLQQMQAADRLTVRGQLRGNVAAKTNEQGTLIQSNLSFLMQPAVFTPGKASMLPLRQELPCETLTGDIAVTTLQWQIDELTCQGADLYIDVRGSVRPRRPVQQSLLNLRLELRSGETFRQELDMLRGLVRQRPSADGSLKFGLRGSVARPRPFR